MRAEKFATFYDTRKLVTGDGLQPATRAVDRINNIF